MDVPYLSKTTGAFVLTVSGHTINDQGIFIRINGELCAATRSQTAGNVLGNATCSALASSGGQTIRIIYGATGYTAGGIYSGYPFRLSILSF